jgi:hypothetical protein
LSPIRTKRIRITVPFALQSDQITVGSDFSNSDIGLIKTLIHSDFSLIRTFVIRSPGIRASSNRVTIGEPTGEHYILYIHSIPTEMEFFLETKQRDCSELYEVGVVISS